MSDAEFGQFVEMQVKRISKSATQKRYKTKAKRQEAADPGAAIVGADHAGAEDMAVL